VADSASIKLKGDNSDLKSNLDESKAMFTEWGVAIKTHIVGMALQLAASIKSAVVDNIKQSFAAAAEAEDVLTKLDVKLKAMGETAARSRSQILDLTNDLAKSTRFDDESITRAQTQLLNFSEISGAMFERTQRAAADLAESMGRDIVSSTQMLGRALANPERGFMMLRQAGITFNEQQRDQIKLMVESGNLLGAQNLILAEVEKRYKGAAEAGVATMVGQMDQFKKAIGDLQEDIGNTFLPLMKELVPVAKDFADTIRTDVVPAIQMWVDSMKGLDSKTSIPKWADTYASEMELAAIEQDQKDIDIVRSGTYWQKLMRPGLDLTQDPAEMQKALDKRKADYNDARDAVNEMHNNERKRQEKAERDKKAASDKEKAEADATVAASVEEERQRAARASARAKLHGGKDNIMMGTLPQAEKSIFEKIGDMLHGAATRERIREMDEAKKPFTSNIEDLVGLNRRISSAAASTQSPEVIRLDKLAKLTEEHINKAKEGIGKLLEPLNRIAKKTFGLG
jgi:hypothetical protein